MNENIDETSTINFNKMCRTCMSCKIDLKCIFDSDISTMLSTCQLIKISPVDGLPSNICIKCLETVKLCYNFKLKCQKSDQLFQKYILEQAVVVTSKSSLLQGQTSELKYDTGTNLNNKSSNKCLKFYSNKKNYFENSSETGAIKNDHNIITEKVEFRECVKFSGSLNNSQKCSSDQNLSLKSNIETEKINKSDDLIAFLDAEPLPPLPFCCTECSFSCNTEYDLNLHISTHTNTGEYVCTCCKKHFVTRQMLQRHIKTHMLHKPHICPKCGKGFAESHALTKHLRKHTGLPREKKHLCTVCGQGFSEPFYLNVHMRKHTGERPLICSACGKSFADPRSLKAHNMIHTGEKPYKCHICSKAFSQSVNLTKHIRVHTGEKPYVCCKCGKCFSQSSSLDKHSRTHTGIRPYACEHCPKRFAEKSTLIHHTRTHTGEKPYACSHCSRTFVSSSELKLHDRKHSGVKKNVCGVCGKDFATPSNLVVHSRTHSGEKPFSCVICDKTFTDKGSLKKHNKVHDDQNKSIMKTNFMANISEHGINVIANVVESTIDLGLPEKLYYTIH